MSRDGPPLVAVVPGAVTALTLLVAFGLLALGVEAFWVAFPVGFGGVMPAALAAARWLDGHSGDVHAAGADGPDRAVAELRERYVRGELSETEFERLVGKRLSNDAAGSPSPERASEPNRSAGSP